MAEEKKYSILLVEDEENLHEALKLNLELEGYDVTSAYNGVAALKAVESEYFDLIIMDVMLPEMDGINVTETIRMQHIDVPILILSAKNKLIIFINWTWNYFTQDSSLRLIFRRPIRNSQLDL